MTTLQETHRPEVPPNAEVFRNAEVPPIALRILAIDEEIEALDRVRPKSWVLLYGSGVISLALLAALVVLMVFSFGGYHWSLVRELAQVMIPILGVPSAVLGLQLTSNFRKRRRLERELDELIAEPIRLPPAPPS